MIYASIIFSIKNELCDTFDVKINENGSECLSLATYVEISHLFVQRSNYAIPLLLDKGCGMYLLGINFSNKHLLLFFNKFHYKYYIRRDVL